MARDPRIDAYIEARAEFARPILIHLREAVHAACPEIEEGIRWGMPSFSYKGRILANMAAFKAHATFGFWRGEEVVGKEASGAEAMGQFGRLTSIAELPDPVTLKALILKAIALNQSSPRPRQPRAAAPRAELEIPEDLRSALAALPAAAANFDRFPPSCRREYVEWITEAKRPETRARRLGEAVKWMAEGKRRNWKYEKC